MSDASANLFERAGAKIAPVVLGDRWEGLKTLIRARLLLATLALPIGLLLRPDTNTQGWWALCWSLVAVGAFSALCWLGAAIRRGALFQVAVQVAFDIALLTAIAAITGARDSQFVLFYVLVVIVGGIHAELIGGVLAAVGVSLGYWALPGIARQLGFATGLGDHSLMPGAGVWVVFLAIVGGLSGVLGQRGRRTREHLERTTRELNRIRVDNDLILRHLTSGVLTVDGTGMVAYLNPAAEEVLGLRTADVRGRWIQDALPERLKPLRHCLLEALEQHEPRRRAEISVHSHSGLPLPLGISTSLLTHESAVTGVVAVFQDLTAVREMERRARRNETLAEVGALAAGIAHELRNGLNPISGSVECLQRELKLDGENAQLMELIATEASRLNRVVSDLLAYSRDRDPVMEAVALDDNLAELCEIVARDPRATPGKVARYIPVDRDLVVNADREQLRQVWLNLATNALEAMHEKGTLVIQARATGQDGAAVEFIDDGTGIAAEDLPRVGQPFFTTKKGGTGLGLAIVQRIVERHGGTLVFESIPGRGTTARVTLPAAAAHMAEAA